MTVQHGVEQASAPPRIVLLGCGGHARELLHLAAGVALGPVEVVACLAEPGYQHTHDGLLPGVGVIADIAGLGTARFVAAVGDGALRERLAHAATQAGGLPHPAFVHRQTTGLDGVDDPLGLVAFPYVAVGPSARVGRHVHLGRSVSVGHDAILGDFSTVLHGGVISGYCEIGPRATIGANATVLPGLRIGADSVVGAGAVVTRNVPDGTVVSGVPARPHRHRGDHVG